LQPLDIRDRIGAVERPLPKSLVVPDVLADRDTHAAAGDRQHQRPRARLEIPPLVEDVIGRQEPLVVDALNAPSSRHDRGVEYRSAGAGAVADDRAEDPRGFAGPARDAPHRALALVEKRGSLEQILGRIAADRQLGKQYEVRASGFGAGAAGQDFLGVALEITD